MCPADKIASTFVISIAVALGVPARVCFIAAIILPVEASLIAAIRLGFSEISFYGGTVADDCRDGIALGFTVAAFPQA